MGKTLNLVMPPSGPLPNHRSWKRDKAYVLLGFDGEEEFWSLLNARVEMSGDTNEWEAGIIPEHLNRR